MRHKRLQLMRASRTDALRATWPTPLEEGVSYHWLTAGDVDASSFLYLLMEQIDRARVLLVSTWTMSREDVGLLVGYLDDDRVDQLTVLTGEYFAQRETAVYATLLAAVTARPGRAELRKLRNNTKLIAIDCDAGAYVVESSANMTTNPRSEQHVLTPSRELFAFYADWFREIRDGGTQ